MRTMMLWFFLSCKRYVHKISFLVILLLLPAVTLFVRKLEQKEGTEIRIAVCVEKEQEAVQEPAVQEPLEQLLADDLVNRETREGMFRFYLCDSQEELRQEVASRRAECGYVIGAGLREKLNAKQYKRCIQIYSAPSTVTAKLSAEVVFSVLTARYDRELFQDYVETGAAFCPLEEDQTGQVQMIQGDPAEAGAGSGNQGVRKRLRQESGVLYDAWMKQGGTFRFVYETVGNKAPDRPESTSAAAESSLFPVRGIVAVYVFVAGLYSAAVSLADQRKGLFLPLSAAVRIPCQLAAMAGPSCLAALSGLLALGSGGSFGRFPGELAAVAAYTVAVTLFSWVLGMVCRREEVVCCLIPFFLIGSLLFCPVIVDISRYLPGLAGIGRLFLPWYYLR